LGILIKAKHKTDIPKLFEATNQIIAFLTKSAKLKSKVFPKITYFNLKIKNFEEYVKQEEPNL
jgi:hypothetical protein